MRLKQCLNTFIYLTCLFLTTLISLKSANASATTCSSIVYPSLSAGKIDTIFEFDKHYKCGQFINGDWWVSLDSSGVLKIISVLPEAKNNLNGLEINPSTRNKQGFDKRINGYSSSLNIKLPVIVSSNSSLVKSISVPVSKKSKCRPCLQSSVVLTVVENPISNSSNIFRPGYFGNKKDLYIFNNSFANSFTAHSITCCNKAKSRDFKKIARRYKGVQLDHIVGWTGRSLHPVDNMPDYGATIAKDNAISILRFMMDDFSINNTIHKTALINYLQMSIDLQSMALNGVTWPGKGGHGNGRKLPMVFAWHLFRKNSFLDALRKSSFAEDEQVYFSKKTGKALFGSRCSDKQYWSTTRISRGPRDCRDPYGYIDGGGHEIGAAYQYCCTAMPWKYTALAVRLLQEDKVWANDAFLKYVDRWVNIGVWAKPDPCASFNGSAGDYMNKYGKDKAGNCIKGLGRYTKKHGANKDKGHYRNAFGDQLWLSYRAKNMETF